MGEKDICRNENCSSFQKVCEDPYQCEDCDLYCCKKCIKGENGCPSTNCENGTVHKNPAKAKNIAKLRVKCLTPNCNKEMDKSEINDHLSTHVTNCVGKSEGCQVSGSIGIISIHQKECLKALKKQQSLFKNFLVSQNKVLNQLSGDIDTL